jgi:L-lactate dehydrogenase complex protein LldG
MTDSSNVLEKIRKALGRSAPLPAPPTPPRLDETVTRLVHTDIGLPELFAKRAAIQNMIVTPTSAADVARNLAEYLRGLPVRRIAVGESGLLKKLNVEPALLAGGFDVRSWENMTLDELYDFDCAVTDATYAVAETGSLVMRSSPQMGRALSLVPMFHVAVIEPKVILPDLVDLFDRLKDEGIGGSVTLVSGPSKTADIEMNVVTGVHGPNVVKVFLLQ